MIIRYRTIKIKKICTEPKYAAKLYGTMVSEKIVLRILQLKHARDLYEYIQEGLGHCHPLYGKRKGQYSIVLYGGFRLIVELVNRDIHIVSIEEIVDYH